MRGGSGRLAEDKDVRKGYGESQGPPAFLSTKVLSRLQLKKNKKNVEKLKIQMPEGNGVGVEGGRAENKRKDCSDKATSLL